LLGRQLQQKGGQSDAAKAAVCSVGSLELEPLAGMASHVGTPSMFQHLCVPEVEMVLDRNR
jgi:hypothetical protein